MVKKKRMKRATDQIRNARDGDGPSWTPELQYMTALKSRLGLIDDRAADFTGAPDDARRMAWSAAAEALGVTVGELDRLADAGDVDRVGRLADHLARLRDALDDAFNVPEIPEAEHSSGSAWDAWDLGAAALREVLVWELEARRKEREGDR